MDPLVAGRLVALCNVYYSIQSVTIEADRRFLLLPRAQQSPSPSTRLVQHHRSACTDASSRPRYPEKKEDTHVRTSIRVQK